MLEPPSVSTKIYNLLCMGTNINFPINRDIHLNDPDTDSSISFIAYFHWLLKNVPSSAESESSAPWRRMSVNVGLQSLLNVMQ